MRFKKSGIVTSVEGNSCIVLTREGTFKRIRLPHAGVRVGEEVSYNRVALSTEFRPLMMAASLLILLMTSAMWQHFTVNSVAAYVSLDINPSLEIAVNADREVLDVKPLNHDAVVLIENEKLQGMDLDRALNRLIVKSVEKNFLKYDGDNLVIAAVSTSNGENPPFDDKVVQQMVKDSMAALGCQGEIRTFKAERRIHDEAIKEGVSAGRFIVYEQIKDSRNDISVKDVKKNSLRKLTKEYDSSLSEEKESEKIKNNNLENQFPVKKYQKKPYLQDFVKGNAASLGGPNQGNGGKSKDMDNGEKEKIKGR